MNRRELILHEIERLVPRVPDHEKDEIAGHALSSKGLKKAAPARAAWLSLVAYIRHVHTDYEALLADGYDVDSARHFCRAGIEEVLASWGCTDRLTNDDDD